MSNPWGAPNPYGYPQINNQSQQAYNPQRNAAVAPNFYQYSVQPMSQFPYASGPPQTQPSISMTGAGLSFSPTVVPFAQPQPQLHTHTTAPQSNTFPPIASVDLTKPPVPGSSAFYQPPSGGFSQPILQPATAPPTGAHNTPVSPFASAGSLVLQPSLAPSAGGSLLQPTPAGPVVALSSTPLRPTPAPERPTLYMQVPLGAPREMAKPQPKPVGPSIVPAANPLDSLFGQPSEKPAALIPSATPSKPAAVEPKASSATTEKPKAFDWSSQDYKSIFAKAVDAPSLVPTTNAFQEFPDALSTKPSTAQAPHASTAAIILPAASSASAPALGADDDDWGAFQAASTPAAPVAPTISSVLHSASPSASAAPALPPATPSTLPFTSSLLTPVQKSTSAIIAPLSAPSADSSTSFSSFTAPSASTVPLVSLATASSFSPASLVKAMPTLSPQSSVAPTNSFVDDEEFDGFQSAAPVKAASAEPRASSPPKSHTAPTTEPSLRSPSPLRNAAASIPASPAKPSESIFVPLTPFGKSDKTASIEVDSKPSASQASETNPPSAEGTSVFPDELDFFKAAVITTVPIKPATLTVAAAAAATRPTSDPTAIPLPAVPASLQQPSILAPVQPASTSATTTVSTSGISLHPPTSSVLTDQKSSLQATAAPLDDAEWGAFEAPPSSVPIASIATTKLNYENEAFPSLSSTPMGSSPALSAVLSPVLASSPVAAVALSPPLSSSSPIDLTNGTNHANARTGSLTLSPPQPPADCVSNDLQDVFQYLVSHFRFEEAVECYGALKAQSQLPALQSAYTAAKEDDQLEEALKLRKEIDAVKKSATPSAELVARWRKGATVTTPFSILSKLREAGTPEATITRLRSTHSQLFSPDCAKLAQSDPAKMFSQMRALISEQEALLVQSEDPERILRLCKQHLASGLEFVKKARSRANEDAAVARLVFGSPKVSSFAEALAAIHQIACQVASQPAAKGTEDLMQNIERIWRELREALVHEGVSASRSDPTVRNETGGTACALCGAGVSRSTGHSIQNRVFHVPCANFYTHLYKSAST